MKLIKTIDISINSSGETYSIYELTDKEIEYTNAPGRYLLNRTYSEYAMKHMSKIDLIQSAMKESVYIYGVAFCDTVKEAELTLKCSILECQIDSLICTFQNHYEDIKEISKEKVSVFKEFN